MDKQPMRRSALYVPASNRRAVEKSRSIQCDVVILDLEDSVAPDMKADARTNAVAQAAAGGFAASEMIIRVNALESQWGPDDLAAVSSARCDAILLPKISTAADIGLYRQHVGDCQMVERLHLDQALALLARAER